MYEQINAVTQFNFQINRVLTYGDAACDHEEIARRTSGIRTMEEWTGTWQQMAQEALIQKKYLHAAFDFRMAEFFLKEEHPQKQQMYERAVDCFYRAFDELQYDYEVHEISYKATQMHSLRLGADGGRPLLICGGYDSFIEEFIPALTDLIPAGYTMYLFEGDGQGRTLKNGLKFIYNWEEPVKCIMDYYGLQNCPMIGISWGGYLAMRAAAFEPRISGVIAYDAADNGYEIMTHILPPVLRFMVRHGFARGRAGTVNSLIAFARKRSLLADWAFTQGMYITGTKSAYEFYQEMNRHRLDQVAGRIHQDCLLLAGEKDHYIPKCQFYRLQKELTAAHSVTARMFTEAEGGEQHCQIGNHRLAADEIMGWIAGLN